MTYNVRKPSYVKTSSNGSTRIPAPRRVSGDMMDSPHSGSFGFRQDLTPTGIRGVAGRVVPSQNIRNVGPTGEDLNSITGFVLHFSLMSVSIYISGLLHWKMNSKT